MSRFCPNPFTWLDLTAWKYHCVKLSLCIESWAGPDCRLAVLPFEEAAELNVDTLWNGALASEIRQQVFDRGCADFCLACPRWLGEYEPVVLAESRIVEAERPPDQTPRPTTLNLAYDQSCNLCCPSCRREPIMHAPGSPLYGHIRRFQDRFVRPLLATARHAVLAGLGDPFGSPLYWELLSSVTPAEAPLLHWYLLTNGQGFTPDAYAAIPTREQISGVQVSVDAAREETYHANRGSSWKRLLENLVFLADLRRTRRIGTFDLSMVFQANNFREIPAFVERAVALGADNVIFNGLLNQGTYTAEDYAARAVHIPGHPQREELIGLLAEVTARPDIRVIVEMPRT